VLGDELAPGRLVDVLRRRLGEVLAPGRLERQRKLETFVGPDDANVVLAHELAEPPAFLASVAHVEIPVRELGHHVPGADLRQEDPGAGIAPAFDAHGTT
jgi:hypothetical protein